MPEFFAGRVAVYYAPARDDSLWRAGCAWLGRDCETGEVLTQPDGVAPFTSSPARYGFHATLKPPMRLRGSYEAFLADVRKLAARQKPFEMARLQVRRIDCFTALCLAAPSAALQELADDCVEFLDSHRVEEDYAARQKRAAGRTARQVRNIERWGYPLVFEDWAFHMTLSDATDDAKLVGQAENFFADAIAASRMVNEICVFVEPHPGGDFVLRERIGFG